MNPFYFGESAEPLFGVHHPPRTDEARESGVVLCYPAGQEYMRAHRAFRQLANLLARSGFHVLRFDYFGTGDSAGEGDAATVERWIRDVGTAADELKDMSDVSSVAVVGLRLGGALAASAASQRDDVAQLVLWDSVIDGKAHLDSLVFESVGPQHHGNGAARSGAREQSLGINGFPFSPSLRAGIERLNLLETQPAAGTESLIVVSSESAEHRAVASAYLARTGRATFTCIPSDGNWNEVDDFGSALIPQAIIRAIVDHLSDRVGV